MKMIAQMTGAVGCFLRRLLSYTTFDENVTPEALASWLCGIMEKMISANQS